jgi:AcrR family transcriptional regulator
MNTRDRRVLRTRRLVRQALLDLIGEKAYEKITIRDITDRADIGYATFFRHYDSVDDLMLEIFTDVVEGFEAPVEQAGGDYFEREGLLLFQHVARNTALYRGLLGSQSFRHKLRVHVQNMVLGHLESHASLLRATAIPREMAALHMVSSLMGLIEWWLERKMDPPAEKMAAVYERLIIRATWQALTPGLKLPLPWERT